MPRSYLRTVITSADGGYLDDFRGTGTAVLRAFQAHTATMRVTGTHSAVKALMEEPEPRAEVWMVTENGGALGKKRLVCGRVISVNGSGPLGAVTVNVADDKSLLDTVLGWQKPSAAINAQTDEYAVYTGPTESVVKAAISANATRLGLPWDVVPTRGAGSPGQRLELRMHDLTRKLTPLLEADRLILSVERQASGRWTVDVVEGATFPRPLTPESGVLVSWEWTKQFRTATRGVGGGRGEGVAREFKQYVDSVAETATSLPLEVYLDARQTEEGVDITPQIAEEVTSRGPLAGLKPVVREAGWFRFPDAYALGDRVPVQVGPIAFEDVITQIEVSHDDDGFRVAPTIGLATADPQAQLLELVKKISTQVRGLERR